MVWILRAIFGAAVVGDFLLAIMLLALWNLYRLWDSPPPLPEGMEAANPAAAQKEEGVCCRD